ncbi:MAG: Uma2 family endonuclease [Chloroflexi bacterium]|nr:Uma2 family endonuclease [Chloroflexota bacterium]
MKICRQRYPFSTHVRPGVYAEAGVTEYWIILGQERLVEVYRRPENGRYRETRVFGPDDLCQHKTWVASLIAEGERRVTEALARGGLAEGAARFKLADVKATLEMLCLAQREWHGPKMPETRRREILKAVFEVEEPAT